MQVQVRYGRETASFEVAEDKLIQLDGGQPERAITDVAGAVAEAIESPLEFPPLRQAIVPGDHVAIVLDEGVPQSGGVLGPVVECILGAGIQPGDVQIVQVAPLAGLRYRLSPDDVPPGIGLVQHDPHDRKRLSYLATTKADTRVYLNREIVDAEVVVLVGRVNYHPILNYSGTGSSVFPGLADEEARKHFRAQITFPRTHSSRLTARQETDEVSWLVGVQFAIQLVTGPGGEVIEVLAGYLPDVQRAGQQRLNRSWHLHAARRAELVIACISGDPDGQGFEELGTVLDSTHDLVEEGGRVVVLSAISSMPGPALQAAQALQDPSKVLDHLRRHPDSDAIGTWQLAQACQHARLFLLSRLPNELVEELFMTSIASVAEVQRLINQVGSCMILNDAQLARVTVEGEHEEFDA